jgi:hypothetical protein
VRDRLCNKPAVDLAVKKVKKLSASQALDLLIWLDATTGKWFGARYVSWVYFLMASVLTFPACNAIPA